MCAIRFGQCADQAPLASAEAAWGVAVPMRAGGSARPPTTAAGQAAFVCTVTCYGGPVEQPGCSAPGCQPAVAPLAGREEPVTCSPSAVPPLRCSTGACHVAAAAPQQEPSWRQRSCTPAMDQPAGSCSPQCEPITPAAAATQAPATPTTDSTPAGASLGTADASQASAADGLPTAAEVAAQKAQRAASAAAVWRRAQSFMHCLAASPLIQSALLSLELEGTHPAAQAGVGPALALQWTVAHLLAMHIKAGLPEATEASVLASLWLMESMQSVWRSPATICLNDYLKYLGSFSSEAVVSITADWRNTFCRLRQSLVEAQADLLKRLDWRIRLDAASEVKPCFDLLFHLPAVSQPLPAAAAVPASPRSLWALRMHRVCAAIKHQAALVAQQERLTRCAHEMGGEEPQLGAPPAKRQRTDCA